MSMYTTQKHKGLVVFVATSALLVVSQQVNAASFALKEQSSTYLGNAFAGTVSASLDASSGYYNPAGLGELKNNQFLIGASYVRADVKLYNATATSNTPANTFKPGNQPSKPRSKGYVPAAHLAWRLNHKVVLGFSVVAPFGLSNKYSSYDMARYMALESKVTSVDISPSIAYEINPKFSVGVGYDLLRVSAILSSNTNFGAAEGNLINKASGWASGYHLGLLYKPSSLTKMGLAYFSSFKPRVSGNVWSANFPGTAPTTLSAHIDLPDRLVYGVTHEYTDKWIAMGELEWTHWSRLKNLRLNYNAVALDKSIEYFNYKNAFRFSLGANYKYSMPLTLKGGLAYEQSPTTNTHRSARLPDSNRYWLALGAKYTLNKNLYVEAGYAHLFFKNKRIAQISGARTLKGNYRSSANIVAVQLAWNFV